MKKFLLSFFGLGFLPIAPGTFGSAAPVTIFMTLNYLYCPHYLTMAIFFFLIVFSSVICVAFTKKEEAVSGKTDPGYIVVDEVAGQAITFLPIIFLPELNICYTAVTAFALFRLFDIFKPWPVRKLEKLPAGWGVLCDDLLAGVYAGIVLALVVKFVPFG